MKRELLAVILIMVIVLPQAMAFSPRPIETAAGTTVNIGGTLKGDKGDPGTTDYLNLTNLPDMTQYSFLNGSRTTTGKWNFGGFNLSNLLNPVTQQDAATKDYVDTEISGISIPIINETYATTANLSITNDTMKTYIDTKPVINTTYLTETTNFTKIIDAMGFRLINITSNSEGGDAVNRTTLNAVNDSMRNNVSANFAPIVGGKVPTENLGSDVASATTYLRGDQTWSTVAPSNNTYLLYSDFFDTGASVAIPGLTGAAISSGTSPVITATTANHPGVISMRDSTTAAGGYKYGCTGGASLIGGGETFDVIFQPVGVRVGQYAQLGWSDTAAAGTNPVDGVWFNITGTGAAISLRGNTSANSVRSGTLTGYTPSTATWYRGTIAINTAGTLVTYTIYNEAGAVQWTDTIAANIPTGAGRDTFPCLIVAEATTDAAADILRLDFVRWGTTRALVR